MDPGFISRLSPLTYCPCVCFFNTMLGFCSVAAILWTVLPLTFGSKWLFYLFIPRGQAWFTICKPMSLIPHSYRGKDRAHKARPVDTHRPSLKQYPFTLKIRGVRNIFQHNTAHIQWARPKMILNGGKFKAFSCKRPDMSGRPMFTTFIQHRMEAVAWQKGLEREIHKGHLDWRGGWFVTIYRWCGLIYRNPQRLCQKNH